MGGLSTEAELKRSNTPNALTRDLDLTATARMLSSPTAGSDDDEYNTHRARVFFGPLKTPEKTFVSLETPARGGRLASEHGSHKSPSKQSSPRQR